MPYIDIPHRDLRLFYTCNPVEPVGFAASHLDPEPACAPFDPEKPVLVLVHASANSVASFSEQFRDARLRRAFNLVGFDARCHGRSEAKPRSSQVLEDSANCIMAGLDKLGFPSYSVYGEGFHGCHIAAWIAIKRPDRVRGIICASPGFVIEPKSNREPVHELMYLYKELKAGPQGVNAPLTSELLEGAASYFIGSDPRLDQRRHDFKRALELRYGAGHSDNDFLKIFSWIDREPIPAGKLATVRAPVLILAGTADQFVSPLAAAYEWQKAFANARGGADVRQIAGAPTLMSYTDPNIVSRFILQFCSRHQ